MAINLDVDYTKSTDLTNVSRYSLTKNVLKILIKSIPVNNYDEFRPVFIVNLTSFTDFQFHYSLKTSGLKINLLLNDNTFSVIFIRIMLECIITFILQCKIICTYIIVYIYIYIIYAIIY